MILSLCYSIMKRRAVKKLFDKKWRQIGRHLETYLSTENPDQLHQFRVQVKKVKSLLRLYALRNKNKRLIDDFKPVNKIFKHAGLIRDAYIHLQLADQYNVKAPEFRQSQMEKMSLEMTKFCDLGKAYLKQIARTGRKLRGRLHGISNAAIGDFYDHQLNGIVLAFAKREFNEAMHDSRKQLKNIIYNHKLADKTLDGNLKLNLAYLDQVQNQLGEWHDGVLARELFASQMNDHPQSMDELDVQVKNLEEATIKISTDFWQQATGKA